MNIYKVIMHLFPEAKPMTDFIIQDDLDERGTYISLWNLEEEQPSEEYMQDVWNEICALPEPEPEETDAEKISRLEEENNELKDRVSATEDSMITLMDTILMLMP